MTGSGFAGCEGTRRHSWASRTSWTKGEYSLWVMPTKICSSAEFCGSTWKSQGKPPSWGTMGNTWHTVQEPPFPATLSVRRKSLVSSGKSWGSFIPARRFLFRYFHFPDTTAFQLLVELEVVWLARLKAAGSGGCRQCERFPPTSLPVSAARAAWRWVYLHSVVPRGAELGDLSIHSC